MKIRQQRTKEEGEAERRRKMQEEKKVGQEETAEVHKDDKKQGITKIQSN